MVRREDGNVARALESTETALLLGDGVTISVVTGTAGITTGMSVEVGVSPFVMCQ